MLNFLFGVLATVAFYSCAPPHIAAKPSEWLRSTWNKIREHIGPNQDG